MRNVWRWLATHQFVVFLVVLTLVTVPAYWQVQLVSARQDRDIACVEQWADESAARSQALGDASRKVDDALGRMLRVAGARDQAATQVAYRAYIAELDAYDALRQKHPVPEPPRLRC